MVNKPYYISEIRTEDLEKLKSDSKELVRAKSLIKRLRAEKAVYLPELTDVTSRFRIILNELLKKRHIIKLKY